MTGKEHPEYCRIVGGKDNGKYVHEGKLYTRQGDEYFNAETGVKSGGKKAAGNRPGQKDGKPPAKRTPAEVKAEREAAEAAAAARAEELKKQHTRNDNATKDALDPEARVVKLMADYSGVEIAQLLTEVKAEQEKANGESDIVVQLEDTEEAVRANAVMLIKHTQE